MKIEYNAKDWLSWKLPYPWIKFGDYELLKNVYENIESGTEIDKIDFLMERSENISSESDDDINSIKTTVVHFHPSRLTIF